jgi:hypothetical protein
MDKVLSAIITAVAPPRGKKPSLSEHAWDCKDSIRTFRSHIDKERLYISYHRRNDKWRGHPTGVAVAFFISGQLYVGASACHLPADLPPKRVRRAAEDLIAHVLDMLQVSASMRSAITTTLHDIRPNTQGTDAWSRHVGIWKAIGAARPIDEKAAAGVARLASRMVATAKYDQREFKRANVMERVARHEDLSYDFYCYIGGSAIPYRMAGAAVSVLTIAMHDKAKADVQAAASAPS